MPKNYFVSFKKMKTSSKRAKIHPQPVRTTFRDNRNPITYRRVLAFKK